MNKDGYFNNTPKTSVVRMSTPQRELIPQLSLADLPPVGTTRWVMRRKAEVVAAVRQGILSLEDACSRYTLSVDEFLTWQEMIDKHGVRALRATRLNDYRATTTTKTDTAAKRDKPHGTSTAYFRNF